MKPKVLLFAISDWANVAKSLEKSLRAVGVKAVAVAKNKHIFEYPEMAQVVSAYEYHEYVAWADVIIFMHSQYMTENYKGKRLFVFHGGTAYRDNPEGHNGVFNSIVEGSFIQTGESLGLGAKNEHWLLPPIDESIQPDYQFRNFKFAHYPRHPDIKGTDIIKRTFDDANTELSYDIGQLSYEKNQERMKGCDVYVEELTPPFEWGLTALESAILGKVTITDFDSIERYLEEYGNCELMIANRPSELRNHIEEIKSWSQEKLLAKKVATRNWAIKQHSFKATGERLLKWLL